MSVTVSKLSVFAWFGSLALVALCGADAKAGLVYTPVATFISENGTSATYQVDLFGKADSGIQGVSTFGVSLSAPVATDSWSSATNSIAQSPWTSFSLTAAPTVGSASSATFQGGNLGGAHPFTVSVPADAGNGFAIGRATVTITKQASSQTFTFQTSAATPKDGALAPGSYEEDLVPNVFTPIAGVVYNSTGSVTVSAVPEPGSLLLATAALCCMGYGRNRLRRRTPIES